MGGSRGLQADVKPDDETRLSPLYQWRGQGALLKDNISCKMTRLQHKKSLKYFYLNLGYTRYNIILWIKSVCTDETKLQHNVINPYHI